MNKKLSGFLPWVLRAEILTIWQGRFTYFCCGKCLEDQQWNDIMLHSGLNPAWHFWLSTRFSCSLRTKTVENISQSLKKQKKCELLNFIVAKIVIFPRQFMVSNRALNTKQVVHCDIVNIGFIVKKIWESVTPLKKLSWGAPSISEDVPESFELSYVKVISWVEWSLRWNYHAFLQLFCFYLLYVQSDIITSL